MPPSGLREVTRYFAASVFLQVVAALAILTLEPGLVARKRALSLYTWLRLQENAASLASYANQDLATRLALRLMPSRLANPRPLATIPPRRVGEAPTHVVDLIDDVPKQSFLPGIAALFRLKAAGPMKDNAERYYFAQFESGGAGFVPTEYVREAVASIRAEEPPADMTDLESMVALIELSARGAVAVERSIVAPRYWWGTTRYELVDAVSLDVTPVAITLSNPGVVAYLTATLDPTYRMEALTLAGGLAYSGIGLVLGLPAILMVGPLLAATATMRRDSAWASVCAEQMCSGSPHTLLASMTGPLGALLEAGLILTTGAWTAIPLALLWAQSRADVIPVGFETALFIASTIGLWTTAAINGWASFALFRARNGPAFRATHPQYFDRTRYDSQ